MHLLSSSEKRVGSSMPTCASSTHIDICREAGESENKLPSVGPILFIPWKPYTVHPVCLHSLPVQPDSWTGTKIRFTFQHHAHLCNPYMWLRLEPDDWIFWGVTSKHDGLELWWFRADISTRTISWEDRKIAFQLCALWAERGNVIL